MLSTLLADSIMHRDSIEHKLSMRTNITPGLHDRTPADLQQRGNHAVPFTGASTHRVAANKVNGSPKNNSSQAGVLPQIHSQPSSQHASTT